MMILLPQSHRLMLLFSLHLLPGAEVQLVEYEASAAGLIRSFRERFPEDGPELEEVLTQLATADAQFWRDQVKETPAGQS